MKLIISLVLLLTITFFGCGVSTDNGTFIVTSAETTYSNHCVYFVRGLWGQPGNTSMDSIRVYDVAGKYYVGQKLTLVPTISGNVQLCTNQ